MSQPPDPDSPSAPEPPSSSGAGAGAERPGPSSAGGAPGASSYGPSEANLPGDRYPDADQGQYPGPGSYPPPGPYPGQGRYPPQPYGGAGAPLTENDERLWGTLTHISVPFFSFVGPLVAYLVLKDRSARLKENATEALNFSILIILGYVAAGVLGAVTFFIGGVLGGLLGVLVWVGSLVLCILAAIAANKGEVYRYPVNWRLVK